MINTTWFSFLILGTLFCFFNLKGSRFGYAVPFYKNLSFTSKTIFIYVFILPAGGTNWLKFEEEAIYLTTNHVNYLDDK